MKNQNSVPIGENYTNRKDCNEFSGNSGRNLEIISSALDGVESSPDSFSQLVPGVALLQISHWLAGTSLCHC